MMRTDYLNLPQTVQLDASGNGMASLRPPTGQYWNPRFVRVATNSRAYPRPTCVLYAGPISARNSTTFIDDTNAGDADASSIISGSLIQFGEEITAVWSGGNPGDTAVLTVTGTTSDTPPQGVLDVGVPGTHFTGRASEEITELVSAGPITLVPSPGNPSSITLGPFDVRTFQSYYFRLLATTIGVPSNYNRVTVKFEWLQPTTLAVTYEETVQFFADGVGGTFAFDGNNLYLQDNHHGPLLQITITSNSGADNINMTYLLNGSTRQLPGAYQRQKGGTTSRGQQGLLLDTGATVIPGAGIIRHACYYSYGRFWERINNTGANPIVVSRIFGNGNAEPITIAAGGISTLELVAIKQATQYSVTSALGSTYSIKLITQFDKG